MTKELKYPIKYVRYITSLIEIAQSVIYADEYSISIDFETKPCPTDTEEFTTSMSILIDDTYLSANIKIYPDVFVYYKSKKYEHIGSWVLHELCHILTHPFREMYSKHTPESLEDINRNIMERQTQRIAISLMGLMPKGWFLPE